MDKKLLLISLAVASLQVAYSWRYSGEYGPEHWSQYFEACGGQAQSPVDVSNPEHDETLTPFVFHGYDNLVDDDLFLKHVGWTVKWALFDTSIGKAYFTGGGLSDKYVFYKSVFHWGEDDINGSGHTFGGHRRALEMHMAHFKEDYHNETEAKKHSDGLAVLAFFFEISETPNQHFQPYLDALANVTHQGEHMKFSYGFHSFMESNKTKYYRYHGSIPHPPCDEVVIWTLFGPTGHLSSAQLAHFRELYGFNTTEHLTKNHRPTQPLHNRKVKRNYVIDSDSGATHVKLSIIATVMCLLVSKIVA